MGAWGVALFSDDLTSDIRAEWRDGLRNNEQSSKLTERLIRDYDEVIEDKDDGLLFWLALASAQSETGHLEEAVRDRALSIIASGGDVARWEAEDPSLARRRETVLIKLSDKLKGAQPKPKTLRKQVPVGIHFNIGDVVKLHNTEKNKDILVIVTSHMEGYPKGTLNPVVEILLWDGDDIPSNDELARVPTLKTEVAHLNGFLPARPHMLAVAAPSKKQALNESMGVVVATGVIRKPAGNPINGAVAGGEAITSYTTWGNIVASIGQLGMERDFATTRKLLTRSRRWSPFKRRTN